MRARLLAAFAAGAIVAGLVVGGVAVAQSGTGTQYTGCVGLYGLLFQVAEGTEPMADCGAGTEVTWNQEGPAGPTGPQGPAGTSPNGRVIPLETDVVISPNTFHSYAAVDTSDCGDVTAHWTAGELTTWRLAISLPGLPSSGTFGEIQSGDAAAWTSNAGTTGASGGLRPLTSPPFAVGPETVFKLHGGNSGGLVEAAFLYCTPRI